MAREFGYLIGMFIPGRLLPASFGLLLLTAVATPSLAAVSPWAKFEGGAVRIISAGPLADGRYDAAIEFALDPGWHTYWESPGEAGIPPQVDWTLSGNLGSARLQYPYPQRYDDGFSISNIYQDGIVLPLTVTPAKADETVRLELDLAFGNCKEVCVPGTARLELTLDPSAPDDKTSARMIARARADVPMPAQDGDPVISRLFLRNDGKKEKLDISLALPADVTADDIEVYAAGPEGASIGVPRRTKPEWKQATGDWVLSLGGLPKDLDVVPLRFVLVAGRHAIEQRFELNRKTGTATEIHPAQPR